MDCFRKRRNQTNDNRTYSPTVRSFALSLHYHSPAGYKFLRKKFNNTLPSPKTFNKWFSNRSLKCPPGIFKESIQTLSKLASDSKEKNQQIFCSLSFDEFAIRQHVQWEHETKKLLGYIHYGKAEGEKLPIAKNILVFMATVLNQNVSIPIAYYPITTLDGEGKYDLLLKIITNLTQIGLNITNIVFDGLASNLNACKHIGCSLNVAEPKTYFENQINHPKIFILFDPCHMIKLIRNTLGDLGSIKDDELGSIDWSYFKKIEEHRTKSKLVTHRFNKRHIQYFRKRMNVRFLLGGFYDEALASNWV